MSAPASGGFASRLFGRFLGSAVSNAAGYGVGGAILPTLEPLTQDLANETWSLHPAKPLPVNAAAEAVLRGYLEQGAGADEALRTGFDSERFATALQLAGNAPPLDALLDLHRRGTITDELLERGMRQLGILAEWRSRLRARLAVLPSVTDMVRFAVREVYDPQQRAALDLDAEFPAAFADDAERLGITRQLAGNYWASHWELPSYTQATEMLFRGEISREQFQRLLRALDYAPTWRGPLEAIARRIPTITDMIRFAVREVYAPAQREQLGLDAEYPAAFTAQAAKHGMAETDARDYWAAHWRLPSALQGYRMMWRGIITPAELDGLLKALDYPPLWRGRLASIAHLVPGRIDLKRMLRHGVLSRDEVRQGYIRLGYTDTDAEHMTAIAVAELGGDDTSQAWASRARSRLFTVAHNEYLDGSIDAGRARELLGQLGATDAEAGLVLELWDAEQTISRLELTPAQVKRAYKKSLYDEATAVAALEDRGMSAEDALTYLQS